MFFEERYIFELDLLLIPFAAFGFVNLVAGIKSKLSKLGIGVFVMLFFLFFFFYYLSSTAPALNKAEIAAINYLNSSSKASNIFVTNTFYSPWVYGFTNKTILSPGMFESVMTFEEWQNFNSSDTDLKIKKLTELREKYGSYYIFTGSRDSDDLLKDLKLKKLYSISGVDVYLF